MTCSFRRLRGGALARERTHTRMKGAKDATRIIERGRRVLTMERDALAGTLERLGDSFAHAAQLMRDTKGRVIVSGVGKSGLIGRKVAATLTSTGTPATFLHPADIVHGDLGNVGAH